MPRRAPPSRFVLTLALVAGGCDHEKKDEFLVDIGVRDSSVERLPGTHTPIPRGALGEITRVGQWLDVSRRALQLASTEVLASMGEVDRDLVLPLVDIDPEGTTGQVVLVRWPGARGKDTPPKLDDAERWVLVSMGFGPDRIIDVELLQGELAPGSIERRRVQALLVAGDALQRRAPGQAFFTIDRFQTEPTGRKRKPERVATVVFALSQASAGPDLELAVEEPKRGKRHRNDVPPLVRELVVHEPGAFVGTTVALSLPDPHPLTVARALQTQQALTVRAGSGTYAIAVDGTVSRTGDGS
ncbi:MAG: hypothetical protein U0168_31390 [Nannocystaceae bacterium]